MGKQDAFLTAGRPGGIDQIGGIFERALRRCELLSFVRAAPGGKVGDRDRQFEFPRAKGQPRFGVFRDPACIFAGDIGIQQHCHPAGRMYGKVGRDKLGRVGAAEQDTLPTIVEDAANLGSRTANPTRQSAIRNHPGRCSHRRTIRKSIRMRQKRLDERLDRPIRFSPHFFGQ